MTLKPCTIPTHAIAHSRERSSRIFSDVVKVPPARILLAISHIMLQPLRTKARHNWQKVSIKFFFSSNSSSNLAYHSLVTTSALCLLAPFFCGSTLDKRELNMKLESLCYTNLWELVGGAPSSFLHKIRPIAIPTFNSCITIEVTAVLL